DGNRRSCRTSTSDRGAFRTCRPTERLSRLFLPRPPRPHPKRRQPRLLSIAAVSRPGFEPKETLDTDRRVVDGDVRRAGWRGGAGVPDGCPPDLPLFAKAAEPRLQSVGPFVLPGLPNASPARSGPAVSVLHASAASLASFPGPR